MRFATKEEIREYKRRLRNVKRLREFLDSQTEEEELEQLWEMAVMRKIDTGLPANIFIDDSKSFQRGRHAMRIKFQPNRSDNPNSRTFISMTLDGDIVQNSIHHNKIELSAKEIKMIQNFVFNNKDALVVLGGMKINDVDFHRLMIPGGKPATPEQRGKAKYELDKLLNRK